MVWGWGLKHITGSIGHKAGLYPVRDAGPLEGTCMDALAVFRYMFLDYERKPQYLEEKMKERLKTSALEL